MILSEADLIALRRLNGLRARSGDPELEALEAEFDAKYRTSSRLAVYGTLAPGCSNHHEVADLGGRWISGLSVRGVLSEVESGYTALRWSTSGRSVPVDLLVSEQLPLHWPRLDAFEGPGYLRILIPVFRADEIVYIANLYESKAPAEDEVCP